MKATFQLERETKGALFYRELKSDGSPCTAPNDPGCIIGTLYVRKSAFDGERPKKLEVTLSQVS